MVGIELTALHWVYLIFIVIIIAVMVMRRDTSLVCIAGIFVLGLAATGSLYQSVMGVFNSFIYSITELLGTILIISVITAMSKVLMVTGINEVMVYPFTKLLLLIPPKPFHLLLHFSSQPLLEDSTGLALCLKKRFVCEFKSDLNLFP